MDCQKFSKGQGVEEEFVANFHWLRPWHFGDPRLYRAAADLPPAELFRYCDQIVASQDFTSRGRLS